MKAVWDEILLAESNDALFFDGRYYFPPESVDKRYLVKSEHITACGWKGIASYYHVDTGKKLNMNAAFCYDTPKDQAKEIKGYIAFWKGVEIMD